MGTLKSIYRQIRKACDLRAVEYHHAMKFFAGCNSILDVGCGTGSFLELAPERIIGIDANPDCVAICQQKGLRVTLGDALNIPHEANSFDAAYCSHVMQVFTPSQAKQLMNELARVVKPEGIVCITTIPFYKRLYFEPADIRPYPPFALRAMFSKPSKDGISAPTMTGFPEMQDEDIWLRRPSLIEFTGPSSKKAEAIAALLNDLQYALYLRKYWSFTGYIMKIRNGANPLLNKFRQASN